MNMNKPKKKDGVYLFLIMHKKLHVMLTVSYYFTLNDAHQLTFTSLQKYFYLSHVSLHVMEYLYRERARVRLFWNVRLWENEEVEMVLLCSDSMIFHRTNTLSRSLPLAAVMSVNVHCEYTEAGGLLSSGETVSDPVNLCTRQPHVSLDECLCHSWVWMAGLDVSKLWRINMTCSGRVFTFAGRCAKQCLIIIVCVWQCVCDCLLRPELTGKHRPESLLWQN